MAVRTVPLVMFGFVKKWKSCSDLFEAKGKRIQVSKRRNGTCPDGLGLVTVDQVRQVTNGAMTTRTFTKITVS